MSDPQTEPVIRPFPAALVPLAEMKRWVPWRWVQKLDKNGQPRNPNKRSSYDKPPLTLNLTLAHTDRDEDLSYYADVAAVIAQWSGTTNPVHGAGFAPRAGDGLLFIDLDECRDRVTEAIAPWAQAIIDDCGSYAEISPSGTGIRIIGISEGWIGRNTKTNFELVSGGAAAKGEIYIGSNYVTVTFNALPGVPDMIQPIGEAANRIVARSVAKQPGTPQGNHGGEPVHAPIDVIRETLAAIPNDTNNWVYWKERVGMAVFAATDGSEEGLLVWDEWSRRCDAYGVGETCEQAWERLTASPPTRTDGYSVLHLDAQKAAKDAGGIWNGGPAWKAWKTGLGALPPQATPAPQSIGAAAINPPVQLPPRPLIQVMPGSLPAAADAAEQALIQGGFAVYVRGGQLVVPSSQAVRTRGDSKVMSIALVALTQASLRDLLSRAADWARWDPRGNRLVMVDPPLDVVAILLDRPSPRPFPEISGVTSTPTILPDGTVSDAVGFDAALGVHRVNDPYLRMPEGWADRPAVKADAEQGMALITDLISGFPFVDEIDRSVGVALILTGVCRNTVPLAPIFSISAPDAGSGKSHFNDVVSMIATGQRCPAASAGDSAQELDKRLTGLIAAGYPMVTLDNVNDTIRSDILNQAVERDRIRLRLLGASSIIEVESRALFTANGNGIRLSGDLVRRNLPIRLDANMEQPEMRAFKFDPLRLIERDRGLYIAALLNALRAHAAAGFPGAANLRPLGSYEPWSQHVRGTLVWLGFPDPIAAMDRARADDPDLKTLRDMLSGWSRRLGSDRSFTPREAADMALQGGPVSGMGAVAQLQVVGGAPEETGGKSDFLDAMLRAAGNRGVVDPARLGNWLNRNAGRITGGFRFVHAGEAGAAGSRWRVERMRPDLRIVT